MEADEERERDNLGPGVKATQKAFDRYRKVWGSLQNEDWSGPAVSKHISSLTGLSQLRYKADISIYFEVDGTSKHPLHRDWTSKYPPYWKFGPPWSVDKHLQSILLNIDEDLFQKISKIEIRAFPYRGLLYKIRRGMLSHLKSVDLHIHREGYRMTSFFADSIGVSDQLESLKLDFKDGTGSLSVAVDLEGLLGNYEWPRLKILHLKWFRFKDQLALQLGRYKSLQELCIGDSCCTENLWTNVIIELRNLKLDRFIVKGDLREYVRAGAGGFREIRMDGRDPKFAQRIQDVVCEPAEAQCALDWLYEGVSDGAGLPYRAPRSWRKRQG